MTKLLTALTTLALALPAAASTWKSDAAHAKAGFSAKHMMITTVRGELGPITSTLELDDKDFTRSKIEATIDATKVFTGVAKRDEHLRSGDFLDTAKFPNVTFKSKKIVKVGDNYQVTGDLTIRDKTKEVVLDAVVTPEVANPWSKSVTRGVAASTTINREDWGLTWNTAMANSGVVVSKEVKIDLEVEYVREEGKAAAKK